MLRSLKELLTEIWGAIRDSSLKCKISAAVIIVLLILFCLVLPILLAPGVEFDEDAEDCGTVMSARSRKALLHWHNMYRSIAAKGEYRIFNENSKLVVLPPATKMHQLWIAQCKVKYSTPGENMLAMGGVATDEYAAEGATKTWADEIAILGISELHLWGDGKAHASQVLWAETKTIGCGVLHCNNNFTKTAVTRGIQQLNFRGNYAWAPMYRAGETLSECGLEGRKEIPHRDTGLCELL
ncbi:SCP-like protein [Ancylostoma caninum]|uniref:SCP-like protein n=1 Tax=Ancylostoma caninum TaxID=29170 RepID=A0A368HAW9_ANCCA|nr:SCP-like protein [Ancylostoma caninum]